MQIKRHNLKKNENKGNEKSKILVIKKKIPQEKAGLVDLVIIKIITIIEKSKTSITDITWKKKNHQKVALNIIYKKWTKKV